MEETKEIIYFYGTNYPGIYAKTISRAAVVSKIISGKGRLLTEILNHHEGGQTVVINQRPKTGEGDFRPIPRDITDYLFSKGIIIASKSRVLTV